MKYIFTALIWGFMILAVASGQKSTQKSINRSVFLKEILGAKYSKQDDMWVLPRNETIKEAFGSDAEGGLFVQVDTVLLRDVGKQKEAWILFTVEGYIFNFCRMIKKEDAWVEKEMIFKLHEGAGGEYAPEHFGFEMIGKKTFISIKEAWYKKNKIKEFWVLYDPLTAELSASLPIHSQGEKSKTAETYLEFETTNTKYEASKSDIPDIVLTQRTKQKKKGEKEKSELKKIRYTWNPSENQYEVKK